MTFCKLQKIVVMPCSMVIISSWTIGNICAILLIRPDSINLLFLISSLDPFQRDERDENKICVKENKLAKKCMEFFFSWKIDVILFFIDILFILSLYRKYVSLIEKRIWETKNQLSLALAHTIVRRRSCPTKSGNLKRQVQTEVWRKCV